MSSNDLPKVQLAWGVDSKDEKFMRVTETDEGLDVVIHPGLSEQQIRAAAQELGPNGSVVIKAWERHMGINT
jgi:hypothetical protein